MESASGLHGTEAGTRHHKHTFTVAKANSALPLVKMVVGDIVELYRQMAVVNQRLTSDTMREDERQSLEKKSDNQEVRLSELVDELTHIGCELKDANMGLVDFIGRHDGRDVYLCWRLGEDQVNFWHDLHAGYAGRRPISSIREDT